MGSLKSEAAGRAAGQRMEHRERDGRERGQAYETQECSLGLLKPRSWTLKGDKMTRVEGENPGARIRALVSWPAICNPSFRAGIRLTWSRILFAPQTPSPLHGMETSGRLP